jgi:type III restriction enzyme
MADSLNRSALEPLFAPWEEPHSHRVRAEKEDGSAKIVKGRRPSPILVAQNIRGAVRDWREAFYAGASDTTRHLLNHWFNRSHRRTTPAGDDFEFRYYFCQREAIETLIFLKEVRKLRCLSEIIAEFGGADAEIAALGITEEEDAWSRYAFKLATGAGKTKVMSLAVVWSYFHALRESESDMARHFVLIAPGLTVYERLKDDFRPGDGRPDIFDSDPLIPQEWRGDWNLSVVLQDEAVGAATGGVLYLTNIHRLYDPGKRTNKGQSDTYGWMGPPVSKTTALDTAAALRDRITKHPRVMVINDEAHHVWDPDSAWNEAIRFIHETNRQRGGSGLVAHLDFSATPKDNKGQTFKHIVCDTPLGEAVDGGIVKTPVIGRADLHKQPGDDAAYVYERHLLLGYQRWTASRDEWKKSGKKALLFVMCNSTAEADQITQRLNTDELFKGLNGTAINLHTNLKGKLKKEGRGATSRYVFVESEKEISDDDLKALRKLSRELDSNTSPYNCIVSVLMLREGWDVRNVTTVVPLRPFSSKANILPEQTLGRGLRRMTPPGQANEIVTVIEHPAFASLYAQELAQEGLPIEIVDIDRVPATTISIYPDHANKDLKLLEIEVPRLSGGHSIRATIENLTIQDVRKEFKKYQPLPLGGQGKTEIQYEGRHLFTNEVIERLKINLPLLQSGIGAVSYFVKQLEQICKLRGTHTVLAPLVQIFLEEILFGKKTDLYDQTLISRLGDSDVSEHLRAVFVPLIRARTAITEQRISESAPIVLSAWKPYQVTHSERHPVVQSSRTLFNLVPCNRELEVAVAAFLNDKAKDVVAFAKNAGPQCLRIDYLASGARLSFYTPDFFVHSNDGQFYLVETKGREDKDVPRKAKAAIAWCEAASTRQHRWKYIYVPQSVFERLTGDTVAELARTCEPALQTLMESEDTSAQMPLFAAAAAAESAKQEKAPELKGIVDEATLHALPPRYRKAVEQATMLFRFFENKEGMNYSPVFTAILGSLDEAARGLVVRRLQPLMPAKAPDQKTWFEPYLRDADRRMQPHYEKMANNLKRTLVFSNGIMPLGLLRDCMEYALNDNTKIEGVFQTVKTKFKVAGGRDLLATIIRIYDFRNTRIAHQEKEITDPKEAERHLIGWINGLKALAEAPK